MFPLLIQLGGIVIALSPGALFNVDGKKMPNTTEEATPLKPGAAFPFVKALKTVNDHLIKLYPGSQEGFRVILVVSDPTQDKGRLQSSIEHYRLTVEVFQTEPQHFVNDLKDRGTHLFLSEDPVMVRQALTGGVPAATLHKPEQMLETSETQLRVAFDADAVLFSDESERVYKKEGLQPYLKHERENVDRPLKQGPLERFAKALYRLQGMFHDKGYHRNCPIRTFLVTSRGSSYCGLRALKTLRSFDLEIDEAFFLSGSNKGPTLQAIRPHVFFDDQDRHINSAKEHGVVSAHVPYGIAKQHSHRKTQGGEH
ncbi:cytosolic 5'-nucleotidase 1A-like [Chanos chanos]|uniref:Cytosolic 5'-nucleotidase 1A-like n=1 Tax=Chanos chanos TaxID=29144 RepID=A0A6J2WYA5_CHACN|nr:cytosolic 5'-nucleotidase 1A-like [Chanos chanos]